MIDQLQVARGGGGHDLRAGQVDFGTARDRTLLDMAVLHINYDIETVNGVVYLIGIVQEEGELARVVGHASAIPGVRHVADHVIAQRSRAPSACTSRPPAHGMNVLWGLHVDPSWQRPFVSGCEKPQLSKRCSPDAWVDFRNHGDLPTGAGGGREALGLLRRGQRLAGTSVITASASRRRRGPWLTNSRIDERSNSLSRSATSPVTAGAAMSPSNRMQCRSCRFVSWRNHGVFGPVSRSDSVWMRKP